MGEEGRRGGIVVEVEVEGGGPAEEDAEEEGGLGAAGAPMGSEGHLIFDDKTGLAKRWRSAMVWHFMREIGGGRAVAGGRAGRGERSLAGGANGGWAGVRTGEGAE